MKPKEKMKDDLESGIKMSDMRIYNLKKKNLLKIKKYDSFQLKQLLSYDDLLGLNVISENINIGSFEKTELLAYDESYCLVIGEWRKDKRGSVVRKGLMVIDYIKNNQAKFKVYLKEKGLDLEVIKNLDLNARLIVFGEDFNEYDYYAIKQTPYEIDLISVSQFDDYLIVKKVYQSFKEKITNKEEIINKLFWEFHDFMLGLGDEICAKGNAHYVIYRRIKTLLYAIITNDTLQINYKLKEKVYEIKVTNIKELEQAYGKILKLYEEI